MRGRLDVDWAVQMSTEPSRCRQSRPELPGPSGSRPPVPLHLVRGAWKRRGRQHVVVGVSMSTWALIWAPAHRHGRWREVALSGETWRRQDRPNKSVRDVGRSAETWGGRQRRGEVGRDVERLAQKWRGRQGHLEIDRAVGTSLGRHNVMIGSGTTTCPPAPRQGVLDHWWASWIVGAHPEIVRPIQKLPEDRHCPRRTWPMSSGSDN